MPSARVPLYFVGNRAGGTADCARDAVFIHGRPGRSPRTILAPPEFTIDTEISAADGKPERPVRLDDFLKRSGLVGTGGEAKLRIQGGGVRVNGVVETRRRKQLAVGDRVEVAGETLHVTSTTI